MGWDTSSGYLAIPSASSRGESNVYWGKRVRVIHLGAPTLFVEVVTDLWCVCVLHMIAIPMFLFYAFALLIMHFSIEESIQVSTLNVISYVKKLLSKEKWKCVTVWLLEHHSCLMPRIWTLLNIHCLPAGPSSSVPFGRRLGRSPAPNAATGGWGKFSTYGTPYKQT